MVEKNAPLEPASALASEIEQVLLARLPALKISAPSRIAGRGALPTALRARYPDAAWTDAPAEADTNVDLFWDAPGGGVSFAPYTPAFFRDVKEALANDGVFFFATLGPQTLLPLHPLCSPLTMPLLTPHAFAAWPTLVDLGDALIAAGLTRPVLDRELLTFTYANADAALAELAQDGWFDAASCRTDAARALTATDGTAAVPFEILYGVARKATPSSWQPLHLVR